MPVGIERIWLCMGCKRDLPRTEMNLHEILAALRTLKPCACGGHWQATVTTQSVHREGE